MLSAWGGSAGWQRLDLAVICEYLQTIKGELHSRSASVTYLGGHRRAFLVRKTEFPCVVKQFPNTEQGARAYAAERWAIENLSNDVPLSRLLFVDDTLRALILEDCGDSVSDRMRSNERWDDGITEYSDLLGSALSAISGRLNSFPALRPPTLTWLSTPRPELLELSAAQRRLLLLLREERALIETADQFARSSQADRALQHGDMKLENLCVAPGRFTIVDFEQLGSGPALWDAAGAIQSMWAHSLIGWCRDETAATTLVRTILERVAQRDDSICRHELSLLLSLRLCQTAIEWEHGSSQNMKVTSEICGLAVSLAESDNAIVSLTDRADVWK